MKHLALIALLLLPALPAAADDGFNAGASFGKSQSGAGTGSLNNPGAVTGAIPGYTPNPPEKGYYNGVTGGDGGLANKGQAALSGNDAAQSVISSGNTNPVPAIDPNAPFITIGKNAEASADGVLNGTAQQCSEVTVSKTTFQNYSCSADVAVSKSCTRDTQIDGHYEERVSSKTIVIPPETLKFKKIDNKTLQFSLPLNEPGATMLEGSVTTSQKKNNGNPFFSSTMNFYGVSKKLKDADNTFDINVAQQTVPADGLLRGTLTNSESLYIDQMMGTIMSEKNPTNSSLAKITVTITVVTTIKVWVASTSTPSVCPASPGGTITGSVCSIPGGDRQVVVDGQTQTVHSDCWQYTDTYLVSENTTGTCASLMSNASCTKAGETCSEFVDGICSHKDYTYQCQTTYQSGGLVCGGDYICKSGACDDTNGAGSNGFDTAVAKLAGLASAAEDVRDENSTINVRAFTGRAMSCRKAFAGFSNCCKDSGWGQDAGLSACNSDEMAIGKAKAKKITVSIGERCDHQVLGACIQKSQVYCVFDGKLARIIQEQGRRDQLGVRFGSGDNPDCRGITVPELQSINFDLINFSDFYEDLMKNQRVPDTSAQVQQIKDRIAAQVNQQGGGK